MTWTDRLRRLLVRYFRPRATAHHPKIEATTGPAGEVLWTDSHARRFADLPLIDRRWKGEGPR